MKQFFLYFFLICLIFFRYFSEIPKYKNGQRIRIRAKVLQEPSRFSNSQKFLLENLKIYLPKYPEVNYGDRVVVEGIVDGDKLSDVVLIDFKENTNFLYKFRRKLLTFYKESLPEPHFSLVSGIVLGYKSNVSENFQSILRKTGTMHVVVASGMNVTFVAGFLFSFLLLFLPRKKAIPFVFAGIWLYGIISGLEAPIVRSCLMATITLGAQGTGRLNSAFSALILSALVMLVINPFWVKDLGFILSFVATASLIIFGKKVESFLKWFPKVLRQDFATTLAAQIGVIPILFVTFGEFNLLSPIINLFVLWTIPFIMIIGSVAGLVGFILPFFGRMILYLCYPLTYYFVNILELLS